MTGSPRRARAVWPVYGPCWFDDRLTTWTRHRSRPDADAPSREAWALTLPDLCSAIVRDGDPPDPTSGEIARLMVMHAWSWLDAAIGDSATMTQPSARRERMQELGPALLAVLRAAAVANDTALRQRIVDAVCDPVFRLGPLLLRATLQRLESPLHPNVGPTRLPVVASRNAYGEPAPGRLAWSQIRL